MQPKGMQRYGRHTEDALLMIGLWVMCRKDGGVYTYVRDKE
jgi:hypothetical protein